MTVWARESTGKCARNLNLTMLTNGIFTTQHPILENDTHKLLWDFDIQTDHLTSARRPRL